MRRNYTKTGYITLTILEHRYVYEQYYNCCLLPWVHIHHKNGIKHDNRIENLQPLTASQHRNLHDKERIDKIISDVNTNHITIPQRKPRVYYETYSSGWN